MSQDQQDTEEDPTFDLEEFVEGVDEETEEQWPFELDENGEIRMESLSWGQKASIYGAFALAQVKQLVYAIVFFYLLIAAVSFLMELTGVAIPVA